VRGRAPDPPMRRASPLRRWREGAFALGIELRHAIELGGLLSSPPLAEEIKR
jgi:hypothetical protein